MEAAILGIATIIVSVGLYLAGVKQGKKQDAARLKHEADLAKENREHDLLIAREQQAHELKLEASRYQRDLSAELTREYVQSVRDGYDSGPHMLAKLGLERLGSHSAIECAIADMAARVKNPWGKEEKHIADRDLLAFFRYLRENHITFATQSVESVAAAVRDAGGVRRNSAAQDGE